MDGFVLVDKGKGVSSFFVVRTLRRIFGVRRVGHGGTLDPLATGLLIVGVGKATKSLSQFLGCDKEYKVTGYFGAVSETYDAEGPISESLPAKENKKLEALFEDDCQKVKDVIKEKFIGEILQTPPKFSALKVGGKRAYDLARKGLEVTLAPRKIFVQEYKIMKIEFPKISFRIKCGSGTYIRSLIHDLGQVLGVGAYTEKLRRTKVGDLDVEKAFKIEDVEKLFREGKPEVFLKQVD
ncbi:MAG: tRNA pseudouridine(55) synthase TruB [Candidatus Peregrinibacteria bacterium]|nr:tRNA pseudouridine(55) synthase TruB [Candidatus Peregrinibacteria bacterium]